MHLVLAYDIPANGRRTVLRKRMRKWLEPVQKSVMEGTIAPKQLDRLLKVVHAVIDAEEDDVRIYVLCDGCRTSTLLVGIARPVRQGVPIMVV